MLKTIIAKEIRDIIGSTKFAVTFGVCAILILLSFYAGANNYRVSRARYEAAKAENLRQFAGLTDWFSVRQTGYSCRRSRWVCWLPAFPMTSAVPPR